jgi:hypothetical protein
MESNYSTFNRAENNVKDKSVSSLKVGSLPGAIYSSNIHKQQKALEESFNSLQINSTNAKKSELVSKSNMRPAIKQGPPTLPLTPKGSLNLFIHSMNSLIF